MNNKQLINKLKNNAELAMAAYGCYDLMGKKFDNKRNKTRKDDIITLHDILDSTYTNYETQDSTFTNTLKLKGDFGKIQVKNFFDKYDLLDFYPKFDKKNNKQIQGFHACLFQDKKSKESKQYTLAIRGSFDATDYATDATHLVKDSTIPFDYLHKMISFYESCAKKYPEITKPKSLNVVGHSLGGCLAQIFALCFANGLNKDSKSKDSNVSATETHQDSIINEVYTFNSPGAKNLKPHITLDSKQIYEVDESIMKASNPAQAMFFKITNKDPNADTGWWETFKSIVSQEQHILIALKYYFSKIPSSELKPHRIFLHSDVVNAGMTNAMFYQVYPISDTFFQAYQTLTHNHNNRNQEDYKLSISDRIFHIESQNKADEEHHAKESTKENATQHLGKDIEGNYFLFNLNFGGLDSHSIVAITKILYFYTYLYETNEMLSDTTSKEVKIEYELHKEKFLKEHSEIDTSEYRECKKALEYCNTIALAVHKILYKREVEKALKEARENGYYEVKTPPNWLYAIIEQRVFEAQIKTKEKKFPLEKDTSNIIEAMLYLQDKGVYIKFLEEDVIKGLEAESLLAYLFAIQESSFFVSVDKELNPLIRDNQTATSLIGYITARTQIFCNPNRKADELLIKCYKNETLALYPRATQGMA